MNGYNNCRGCINGAGRRENLNDEFILNILRSLRSLRRAGGGTTETGYERGSDIYRCRMNRCPDPAKRLAANALLPVGNTLYIWGGGWNENDDGAGEDAKRLGLNPNWRRFFMSQDKDYDYNDYRYRRGLGLDCSGFVGWAMYNTLYCERTKNIGYVASANAQAEFFSKLGLGTYTDKAAVKDHRLGDIMSGDGHVYIVLNSYADGSVLLVHSSPPGVQISGTVSADGSLGSAAARRADLLMSKFYPTWYARYGSRVKGIEYLKNYSQCRQQRSD